MSSSIRITLINPAETEKTVLEVPGDVPIRDLIEAIVEQLQYPTRGANGRPLRYQLYLSEGHDRLSRLNDSETLAQNGIQDSAVLQLSLEMLAGCFAAGTKVMLANKRQMPIEEIKVGDRLLSYSATEHSLLFGEVTEVYKGRENRYLIVNGALQITPSHLIYANNSWKRAEALQSGDILLNESFNDTLVESVVSKDEEIDVYNLNLSDDAPFFAQGLLVHNLQSKQENKFEENLEVDTQIKDYTSQEKPFVNGAGLLRQWNEFWGQQRHYQPPEFSDKQLIAGPYEFKVGITGASYLPAIPYMSIIVVMPDGQRTVAKGGFIELSPGIYVLFYVDMKQRELVLNVSERTSSESALARVDSSILYRVTDPLLVQSIHDPVNLLIDLATSVIVKVTRQYNHEEMAHSITAAELSEKIKAEIANQEHKLGLQIIDLTILNLEGDSKFLALQREQALGKESPGDQENIRPEMNHSEPDEQQSSVETHFKLPLIIETNKRTQIVTDISNGLDKLNYSRYASAFADLITNPEMSTPITIGIYGDWGSGKSFLMNKIKEEVLAQQKKIKKPKIDIHIIDFNAWVYSGSEHLWASLVTHLYRDIEKHFGVKAHWMRLSKAIRRSLPKALGVFAFYALLGLLLSLLLNFNEIQTATSAATLAVNAVGASVIGGSALASIPALWSALREFFDSLFLSRANKLQNLAAKPDFRNQIGIMADIKDEIRFIRELLKKGKNGKPTRLVLFIDDLDRCEHRKAVEVLQAIMLLLADEDGSPFVIFLGIDARVVVRAIDEYYGEVLVKAGINGYEYLDKIIQVPFVIPAASQGDIDNYVESLLWASDDEKDTVDKKMTPPISPSAETVITASGGESVTQQGNISEPQLPTDAELVKARQKQPNEPEPPVLEEVPVTFTLTEREALKACVADLSNNPRKIKRIINIYRLARLILPTTIERDKAIRWILMTEQWPLHVAWMIELVENDAQTGKQLDGKGIADVFKAVRANIHAKEMETLLEIDADPELFAQFIEKAPAFSVQEIKTLLPYTFNLNPAIRSEVTKQALKLTEPAPQPAKKPGRAKTAAGTKKKATAAQPA